MKSPRTHNWMWEVTEKELGWRPRTELPDKLGEHVSHLFSRSCFISTGHGRLTLIPVDSKLLLTDLCTVYMIPSEMPGGYSSRSSCEILLISPESESQHNLTFWHFKTVLKISLKFPFLLIHELAANLYYLYLGEDFRPILMSLNIIVIWLQKEHSKPSFRNKNRKDSFFIHSIRMMIKWNFFSY